MSTGSVVRPRIELVVLVLLVTACRPAMAPADALRLQGELERAVAADELDHGGDEAPDKNVQAFLKRHGEEAVPLLEKLVTNAAETGADDKSLEVKAAIKGLVLLRKGRARDVLERLAKSPKAEFELSRAALNSLVQIAPENERVTILATRLREHRDDRDLQWTISDLMSLGRTDAVPHLQAIRPEVSDADMQAYIDTAIRALADPSVCTVHQEIFRETLRKWDCAYTCAGRTRTRLDVSEAPCPRTIPNQDP